MSVTVKWTQVVHQSIAQIKEDFVNNKVKNYKMSEFIMLQANDFRSNNFPGSIYNDKKSASLSMRF